MDTLSTMARALPHCRLLIPTLALVAAMVLTAFVPALFIALALIQILAVSWLALRIRWRRIARTRRGLLRCCFRPAVHRLRLLIALRARLRRMFPARQLLLGVLLPRAPLLSGLRLGCWPVEALLRSVRTLLRALSGTRGADHHVFTRLVAIVL